MAFSKSASDELADLVLRVRLASREHGNNRIRSNSVESIRIASNHAFKRVMLHYRRLECLLRLGLTSHG